MSEENTQLTIVDIETINKSKMLSNSMQKSSFPYVPVVKINQKGETKLVNVEGVDTEVTLPIKKGFTIRNGEKDQDGKFITEYFKEDLSAVILLERYRIVSKHKVEPTFYSREFNNFSDPITVYSGQDVVAQGTYKKLKETFATAEMDSNGRNKKSFDLFLVLYLWLPEEDRIVKLENRMTGKNPWFDYVASFGEDDHYTAHKTNFVLHEDIAGKNVYYYIEYVVGDPVNVNTVINKQIELRDFLFAKEGVQEKHVQDNAYQEPVIQIEEAYQEDVGELFDKPMDNREISIDEIPF